MSERVAILGAGGDPLGWTYDGERYRLVRGSVLDAMAALAGDSGGCAAQGRGRVLQRVGAGSPPRLRIAAQL